MRKRNSMAYLPCHRIFLHLLVRLRHLIRLSDLRTRPIGPIYFYYLEDYAIRIFIINSFSTLFEIIARVERQRPRSANTPSPSEIRRPFRSQSLSSTFFQTLLLLQLLPSPLRIFSDAFDSFSSLSLLIHITAL